MRLFLIRHGQIISNVKRILDGAFPGPSLNETGRRQAAELPTRLAGEPITAVYSSDFPRAIQTAAPLAEALGVTPRQLPGLREIPAGNQQGSADHTEYITMLHTWRTDPSYALPDGESGESFIARYDAAVAEISAAGDEVAAAVSHGAAMRVWTPWRCTNLDHDHPAVHELDNVEIIELEGSSESGWRCVRWGDEQL